MEELRHEIDLLNENISNIKDNEYKKYFNQITSILDLMTNKIEELAVNQETIEENIRFMDNDLTDIQDELFEEVSIDDLNDMEEQYTEFNCIHCGKSIFIEQSALSKNEEIPCPYCNKNIKK